MKILSEKKRLQRFIKVLGVMWAFALATLLIIFLLIAVANGGVITLTMTVYNEMMFEYILLAFVIWPICSIAFFYFLEDI